tara:strand:- start:101 stop:559 length:459 start_codon:yes stop_codon:yes gene_type:complete
MKKYIILISLLLSNIVFGQNLKPLTNNTFEDVMNDENANHLVIEGCISLYAAITELIKKEHPDLAKSFFEMANTLYPYGLVSLAKIQKINSKEAEEIFYKNINYLSKIYIQEMKINGKKHGSYLRGNFLGDDLYFCNEVTKALNLVVKESSN